MQGFKHWRSQDFWLGEFLIGGVKSFPGGTEIDAWPPKLSEEHTDQSKKVFTQFWSDFLPKIRWRAKKKGLHSILVRFFAQKSATDERQGREKILFKTWRDNLISSGPPKPGPGYDVPLEPPSRRPWTKVIPTVMTNCCINTSENQSRIIFPEL